MGSARGEMFHVERFSEPRNCSTWNNCDDRYADRLRLAENYDNFW